MKRVEKLLFDLGAADNLAAVGGKAYHLYQLHRLGLPTPDGVVIPDGIFQAHLAHTGALVATAGLLEKLATLSKPDIDAAADQIRNLIMATAVAPALMTRLMETWQSRWPQRLLAVRSSAVGEDSARTSFAGQLNSSLNVDSAAALETAIKDTWSSLFSSGVLLYGRHHSLRPAHLGVIIQPQVAASFSGVMFSRDPAGQRVDGMLAEYCRGLGDQVVSGAVTPSRLCIDRSTLAVTCEYLADDMDALPAAAIQAVKTVARMALTLERHSGITQDLEWCIDEAGEPILVQSRPATRLAAPQAGEIHWSNANIAENFPEPVSPLLFSIVKPGYTAYFRNLGLGFGLSRRRVAAMAEPLQNIVGLQGGRLYYNLSNIHWLLQMMPAGHRLVEFFNLFVGASAIPPPPRLELGLLERGLETLRVAAAICWQYLPIKWRIRRFEARADEFARQTQPERLEGRSTAELVSDLRGFLTIRLRQWNDAALADTAAMVCYGLLKAQLARHLPGDDHEGIHNDLLKGLPGLASAEPVIRLWRLSQRIAGDHALETLFGRATAEEVLEGLRLPEHADFRRAFFAYLERWGFRSSAELMLTRQTPAEDPRPVIRLLQAYVLARAASPEALSEAQGRERQATTRAVAAQLSPSPLWRAVPLLSRASRFRILLRATQGAIKLRERARMKQALLYTRLRHIALGLGDRLVACGGLAQRDDIFLLSTDEVIAAAASEATTLNLAGEIERRRQILGEYQAIEPPDRLALGVGEHWTPAMGCRDNTGAETLPVLQGNGACGGSASGCAAVVLDVSEADRVRAGQILVTRQTDPGWATVFFLVHGLVIERGGMLSHGAIIAREYGIPAVVGVADATRLIRDGDRLRVDGDRGRVELNGQ